MNSLTMNSPTIKELVIQGESQHLEFKEDTHSLDRIAAVVVSFLNSGGGTLLVGVRDDGEILGIRDAVNEVTKIQKYINQKITPKPLVSVSVDNVDNVDIISIDVPAAKDTPFVVDGKVYTRSKSITQPIDGDTLRRMIREHANEAERWERRISPEISASDIIETEVSATVGNAVETGRFLFNNSVETLPILKELGLAKGNQLTNAADILFGRDCASRHPQIRVRATRFLYDKGTDYLDDQVYQEPLCLILPRVEEFILRNIAIGAHFTETNLLREEHLAYPRYAIREGLVNAFVHRDYASFTGGLSVGIYPSRIEIWNSGHLPKELDPNALKYKHPSLPTNPDIAHVFYIRKYMERIGRGTEKIIEACKEQGLPSPVWKDTPIGVTLTLFAAKKTVKLHLKSRQEALLSALNVGDSIRPAEYRERFAQNVSERQARRDLIELENSGYLEKAGKGAASQYRRKSQA